MPTNIFTNFYLLLFKHVKLERLILFSSQDFPILFHIHYYVFTASPDVFILFCFCPLKFISFSLLFSLFPFKCQPGLNEEYEFERDGARAFRRDWYEPKLKNGMKSYREWLIYSPRGHCAYCLPCWLFANRSRKDYEPAFSEPENGFKSWKKATNTLKVHEECEVHADAVRVMIETKLRLNLGKAVDEEQVRAHERQIKHNRQVLCRLIDTTLFLAKQNLAFCGSKESPASTLLDQQHTCGGKVPNEGNFLELIKLLAKYDGILAHHLATAPKNASYLSPHIQNEFIKCLADTIRDNIIKEIQTAVYYGVIMDSTIDISHTDQFSFCIRYVDQAFQIQERFILFTDIKRMILLHYLIHYKVS